MAQEIHYTDIGALNHHASLDWTGWGDPFLVTAERVAAFADATENHQWVHVPASASRESPYGKPIAHGLLIWGLMQFRLLPAEGFTLVGHRCRMLRRQEVTFPAPVYFDDRIRMRQRWVRAYAAPSGKGTIIERRAEVWALEAGRPAVSARVWYQYF